MGNWLDQYLDGWKTVQRMGDWLDQYLDGWKTV